MKGNDLNNKRIAKNTILLYFRQFLIMFVSLYTSRVVLQALGVTDFGIFNVVGGMVTMFSFLMTTMASASQRYLSYDLAIGDFLRLQQTFSLIMLSYILLIIITIALIESIAIWFLNTYMTIPSDRLYAANWTLQFAILSFAVNIFATPYLSVIIAHEKMNVYAYVSIADVSLKLLVVVFLEKTSHDKLIVYATLMFVSSLLITLLYMTYCKQKFKESHYHFFYCRKRLVEIVSFAWWNMLGAISNLCRSQGINILLNIFFDPVVNAARGIAYQVNSAITGFANNFYTAVRPQVIKSYASGNITQMISLVSMSSRFAFYLMLIMSLPILLNTEKILELWLVAPPKYATLFVQLIIINALLEVFSLPLTTGLQATGNIKKYQMVVSGLYLLNIPVSYLLLKLGCSPEVPMYVNIILVAICMFPRLILCKSSYGISISYYLKSVLLRTIMLGTVCFLVCKLVIVEIVDNYSLARLLLNIALMLGVTSLLIYFGGITKIERTAINNIVIKKINKL